MEWRSPRNRDHDPARAGEYVVSHERPYPERLDRGFRIGATVAGSGASLAAATALLMARTAPMPADVSQWSELALLIVMAGGLAYAFVRMVGMFAVGFYGLSRKRQYVVDWQGGPDRRRQSRRALFVGGGLLLLVILLALADRH